MKMSSFVSLETKWLEPFFWCLTIAFKRQLLAQGCSLCLLPHLHAQLSIKHTHLSAHLVLEAIRAFLNYHQGPFLFFIPPSIVPKEMSTVVSVGLRLQHVSVSCSPLIIYNFNIAPFTINVSIMVVNVSSH